MAWLRSSAVPSTKGRFGLSAHAAPAFAPADTNVADRLFASVDCMAIGAAIKLVKEVVWNAENIVCTEVS